MDDRSRSTPSRVPERTRAGQRTLPSEDSLRSILDNIQEAVYRTDTDGRIIWASPSCERLWGYAPGAVIGTFLAGYYVAPGERARFLEALERGGGTITNYEALMRPAAGGTAWVSTNAHYYRDAQGAHIGRPVPFG